MDFCSIQRKNRIVYYVNEVGKVIFYNIENKFEEKVGGITYIILCNFTLLTVTIYLTNRLNEVKVIMVRRPRPPMYVLGVNWQCQKLCNFGIMSQTFKKFCESVRLRRNL